MSRTMTPERERDIRATLASESRRNLAERSSVSVHTYCWQVSDLLAEIDALRAEKRQLNDQLADALAPFD